MVQPFNYPSNLDNNTVFQGGLRAGPTYTGLISNPPSSSINSLMGKPLYSSSSFNKNGAGIYYSPINTYRFRPYNGTQGNIVDGVVVTSPGWLTLNGDGAAATLMRPGERINFGQILPPNSALNVSDQAVYVENAGSTIAPNPVFPEGAPNTNFLLMDYPRCPAIGLVAPSTSPTAPTAPIVITVFGFDSSQNSIQHTYTIYNTGTAPSLELNVPNGVTGWLYGNSEPGAPFQNTKAFYGITGIYCNGITGNYRLFIMTSNTFGLPYAVQSYSQVIQMIAADVNAQEIYDCMNPTYIFPQVSSDADDWGTFVLPEGELARLIDTDPNVWLNHNIPIAQIVYNPSDTVAVLDTFITPREYVRANSVGEPPKISYGVLTEKAEPGIVPSDGLIAGMFSPNGGRYRFKPADTSTPSATSGDPRGLIQFADLEQILDENGDIDNLTMMPYGRFLPVNGVTEIIFSAYIKGADEQINQCAAGYQPEGYFPFPAPPGTPAYTLPLTFEDLSGQIPFYSGVIS